MATSQPRRAGSEQATAPVAFSYAMAAKGLSSGPATAAQSNSASGSSTPAKDPTSTAAPVASVASWADDAEEEHGKKDASIAPQEERVEVQPSDDAKSDVAPVITSIVSSPDLGASSASTAVKDDDVSSLQNAASESTWESKSQASTSVEKSSEAGDKTSERGKGKKTDKNVVKTLYEAPVPAVNPWTKRLEEQKKMAQKPAAPKPSAANGTVNAGPAKKAPESKERAVISEGKPRTREQEKDANFQSRKDFSSGADFDRTKKSSKGRSQDRDLRPTPAALPLPPNRDQESWPTPENALDEDRKKSQGKVEKLEKERKDGAPNKPHGKKEWVTVPHTPTVIFNTPLPNAAGARRGGRGGGRGGSQSGGRGGGFGANGAASPEKDASASSALTNGDHQKRGRSDGSSTRDASPQDKRTVSAGSTSLKEGKSPASVTDKSIKPGATSETDAASRTGSVMADAPAGGANNSFPRQYPPSRQNKGRKGDGPGSNDRRRDNEVFSPSKENSGPHDKRTVNPDAPEDGDRRAPFHEGQAVSNKSNNNERRFSSFSGRERGRGGRGGRGGFQNSHQFTNGQAHPSQSSSAFPLARSPTTFQPEQGAYFAVPASHGRSYRNSHRSQSVTNDNGYSRGPYPGGHQQLPPIQTYSAGPVYDYSMVPPPMNSAVSFSPYGVDQWTLAAMVSTQMEYYFSIDNLCKDVFLRKHMDGKGFVFLSVLADFNRIKNLTTNVDILKHVCHTSPTIEYRIGADGKDRLRVRDGWEKWVMTKKERDITAQNDGPEELHSPPVPHPLGFEQPGLHRYPEMGAGSPTGPVPFQPMNGFLPSEGHDAAPLEHAVNGHVNGVNGFDGSNGQVNGVNGYTSSNGQPIEAPTNNA